MTNSIAQSAAADPFDDFKAQLEALPGSSRFTRSQTEAIYAMGYQLTAQGRPVDAHGYFTLLAIHAPTNTKYLTGLALTSKQLQRYDQALNVYAFCARLEPTQPQHMLGVAECLMHQGDRVGARESFELVAEFCAESGQFQKVGDRAQAMLELMDLGASKGAATAGS